MGLATGARAQPGERQRGRTGVSPRAAQRGRGVRSGVRGGTEIDPSRREERRVRDRLPGPRLDLAEGRVHNGGVRRV